MNSRDEIGAILRRTEVERVVELSPEELAVLLETAVLVSEDDSGLTGPIRVLDLGGRILVQERSDRGELLLREVESRDEALRFVAVRLEAYERMWDG